MELSVARRLAWAAEQGGIPLPAHVALEVGAVLAKGAKVEVAPAVGCFVDVENQAQ